MSPHPLLKKLNFRDHSPIVVLNAPDSFAEALAAMNAQADLDRPLKPDHTYAFALAFVQSAAEIETLAPELVPQLGEDAPLWIAYPKKSSQKYSSDIGRDHGWQPFGDRGYEGVRMVAIDEDWSALRLRHVDHIKTMKRDTSRAMSKKGKKRTS